MLPRTAADFYGSQQRLAVATVTAGRRAWQGMGEDFDASWGNVAPRLVVLTSSAQLAAARNGAAYVGDVLEETGQPNEPDAQVNPRALVGTAADGRSLNGLLSGAVVQAKSAMGQGFSTADALARGGRWLDMVTQTVVADAGRQATGLGIVARPRVGWTRMVNPPCCPRCAILAGKWFSYNQGFQRHPRCDCTHIPSTEDRADEFRTDPQKLLDGGHVTISRTDARAVADGANLNRVVNAHGGTRSMTTTTAKGGRLSPEDIYRSTATREEAVRLLKRNGYFT